MLCYVVKKTPYILTFSKHFLNEYSYFALFKAFYDLMFEMLAILMYSLPNISKSYSVRPDNN